MRTSVILLLLAILCITSCKKEEKFILNEGNWSVNKKIYTVHRAIFNNIQNSFNAIDRHSNSFIIEFDTLPPAAGSYTIAEEVMASGQVALYINIASNDSSTISYKSTNQENPQLDVSYEDGKLVVDVREARFVNTLDEEDKITVSAFIKEKNK